VRRVRRAALAGQILVAVLGLHLMARDAVAGAVALAPNANGVTQVRPPVPPVLAADTVKTIEGASLSAWLVEARAARRFGTIVLLHGVRADKSLLAAYAHSFVQAGYAALLVDLPGHGQSEGRFLGYGPAEARRVERFLDDLYADAVIGPEPLGVFGFSYGGAVAVELAARDPRVKAAVVVSAFASLRQVVSDYRVKYLPSALAPPDSWFQTAVNDAAVIAGFDPERGPVDAAASTKVPILYVHGAADDQVPALHSRRLARATPRGELVIVKDLTHDGVPSDAAGAVRRSAGEWFQRWLH
jgi:uncharacterized protein